MSRQTWRLLALRLRERRTLVETAEVWRPTPTADGQGGTTLAYARVATLPCRVDAVTEADTLIAQRVGKVASAVVVFAHDAGFEGGDEVRVGDSRYTFIGSDAGRTNPLTLRAVVEVAR